MISKGRSVQTQQGLLPWVSMDSPTILLIAEGIPQRPQQVDAGPIGVHAQMERARCPELRRQLLQCGSQHFQLPCVCRRPPDLHDMRHMRGRLSTTSHR